MDYRLNRKQEAFRKEFVSWLAENLPAGWDPSRFRNFESSEARAGAYRSFQGKLARAGYAAMHYPKAYGGQGRSLMEDVIVLQTLASACMELRMPGSITHGMAAPTILHCGNEEQKKKYLPKIIDGTHIWCQGFSEPNAGSDVANVSTRAVKENGHYVLNGQKLWTSCPRVRLLYPARPYRPERGEAQGVELPAPGHEASGCRGEAHDPDHGGRGIQSSSFSTKSTCPRICSWARRARGG